MTPGELAAEFSAAAIRAGSLRPVLAEFSNYMKGSVNANFWAQGRPVAWPETKYPPKNHIATLRNTNKLFDSATAFPEGNTDVLLVAGGGGQRPAKAPSLQYGANLNMRRHRDTGHFAKKRARTNVSRGGQHVIGYGVLPPRPYLMFQPEDIMYFGTLLPSYVFMSVRRG